MECIYKNVFDTKQNEIKTPHIERTVLFKIIALMKH